MHSVAYPWIVQKLCAPSGKRSRAAFAPKAQSLFSLQTWNKEREEKPRPIAECKEGPRPQKRRDDVRTDVVCTIIDAYVQHRVHLVAILAQFDTCCVKTAMIEHKN